MEFGFEKQRCSRIVSARAIVVIKRYQKIANNIASRSGGRPCSELAFAKSAYRSWTDYQLTKKLVDLQDWLSKSHSKVIRKSPETLAEKKE